MKANEQVHERSGFLQANGIARHGAFCHTSPGCSPSALRMRMACTVRSQALEPSTEIFIMFSHE
jgi:hypothetical protein